MIDNMKSRYPKLNRIGTVIGGVKVLLPMTQGLSRNLISFEKMQKHIRWHEMQRCVLKNLRPSEDRRMKMK